MRSKIEIPRYDVLDVVGEGALATVHRVRSRRDGSIRALKALKPEQASTGGAVERFVDEYRILSALHHPCLPEVHDYGFAAGGAPFMVMDFIEGVPLDEYIRENPDDLWRLLFQLNEALAFIHEHDLLHLDLKPSNVLVKRTKIFGDEEMPLAVLIDFGLSYRREAGGKVKLVGTPGYMAPEIIRGEENLTRAVDYYSLGVIVYQLIEGALPFSGDLHDVLRAHLTEDVRFEKDLVQYAELQPWVRSLMSKAPLDRLEAFQGFRRAVAARLGDAVAGIERVFALGYIESLGLVGKEEAWGELRAWASKLGGALAARRQAEEKAAALKAARDAAARVAARSAEARDVLAGSASGLGERIREDLMAAALPATEERGAEGPIESLPRVVAITGPPESGKSRVIQSLRTELKARGVGVVSLGVESEYATLLPHGRGSRTDPTQVEPGALILDRFSDAWDELFRMGQASGVVVLVDDLERASAEEKEFLDYIGKRAGQELDERKEPGVFVIAVGSRDDVSALLRPVVRGAGAVTSFEVPPPGKQDAQTIATGFRGSLSGASEERAISAYLETNLETGAVLHQSLKHAVVEGFLIRQRGKWEFHERMVKPLEHAGKAGGAYYGRIMQDLAGTIREAVAVLACHPAPLTLSELAAISGLTSAEIDEALESVRPYRIVGWSEKADGRSIEMVSDQVRRVIMGTLAESETQKNHGRLIEYFTTRPADTVGYFELMGFHHEKLGLARDSLLMRVRAIAVARRGQDVFALRRLCERGIEYVRGLDESSWAAHKWPLERYFIKQWIDAEFVAANFRNLVSVVKDQLLGRKRDVPLSFLYKYSMALERVGEVEECKKVLSDGQERLANGKSETYYLLLLQESRMLLNTGLFDKSLLLLRRIKPEVLPPPARARLYVTYIHNYQDIGEESSVPSFLELIERLPKNPALTDQLLRAEYSKIRRMLAEGSYSAARTLIGAGIRRAAKHKAYRSLCSMYFIASTMYYEMGYYKRTMIFLDKAIRVGKRRVSPEWGHEWVLRYAYIYRKLGLYGNAIERAKSVARAANTDRGRQQYFTSLVALLDNYVTINSPLAAQVVPELVLASKEVQDRLRLGAYHRTLGRYYAKRRDTSRAIDEFETARLLFSRVKMLDEEVGAGIALARLLIDQERLDDADMLIHEIEYDVVAIESKNVLADYLAVQLRYLVASAAQRLLIEECIYSCEATRQLTTDVGSAMTLDAELFKGAVAMEDVARASAVFDRFYEQVRFVVSNLSKDYVSDYIADPELMTIIDTYRSLKKQGPGRR